jgi:putative redox protein
MAEVKTKSVVTMRASAACPSHARTDIKVRDVHVTIDEPVERGGTNAGPTPTEAALSALIACTNVIGHKCADKLGVSLGHLEISAACEFDRRGVTLVEAVENDFLRIDLTIVADGELSDVELQSVAAETSKFCPLSKLFKAAGTTITETWRKAGT